MEGEGPQRSSKSAEQEQRPDEQRLRQAMDNRNRLKTVACDLAIQVHGRSSGFRATKSPLFLQKGQRHGQAEDAEYQ